LDAGSNLSETKVIIEEKLDKGLTEKLMRGLHRQAEEKSCKSFKRKSPQIFQAPSMQWVLVNEKRANSAAANDQGSFWPGRGRGYEDRRQSQRKRKVPRGG